MVQDAALWHTLLRVVARREAGAVGRHTFLAAPAVPRPLHAAAAQSPGPRGSPETSRSATPTSPGSTHAVAGGGGALDAHSVQQLEYTGSPATRRSNETVGIAAGLPARGPSARRPGYAAAEGAVTLPAGGGVQLRYFETEIANQGAKVHRRRLVPDDLPAALPPAGVGAPLVRIPRRRRPRLQRLRLRQALRADVRDGVVVGSGIVEVHGDSYEEKGAYIFYTVDGEVVGTPFKKVPRPERLHPCRARATVSLAAQFLRRALCGAA